MNHSIPPIFAQQRFSSQQWLLKKAVLTQCAPYIAPRLRAIGEQMRREHVWKAVTLVLHSMSLL